MVGAAIKAVLINHLLLAANERLESFVGERAVTVEAFECINHGHDIRMRWMDG